LYSSKYDVDLQFFGVNVETLYGSVSVTDVNSPDLNKEVSEAVLVTRMVVELAEHYSRTSFLCQKQVL
jgi:hypothetical protein